jgi:hypothetical protein
MKLLILILFPVFGVFAQDVQNLANMKQMKENRISLIIQSKCFVPDSNGKCNDRYAKDIKTSYFDSLGRKFRETIINGSSEDEANIFFDSLNRPIKVISFLFRNVIRSSTSKYKDSTIKVVQYFYNKDKIDSVNEKSVYGSSTIKYSYNTENNLVKKTKINFMTGYSDTSIYIYVYKDNRIKYESSSGANREYFYESDKSINAEKTVTIFDNKIRSTIYYNSKNTPYYQTQNFISDNAVVLEAFWTYNELGIESIIVKRQRGFGSKEEALKLRTEYIETYKYIQK